MNLLRNDDSSDLEAELRAVLRRRSAHVDPDQPEWQDLVQRRPAAVYSLYDGSLYDGSLYDGDGDRGSVASPWRQRPKPVFIAAAAVAVVLAGGVAARSATDSPPSSGLDEAPASFSVAAPTEAGFDAHTAPAVYTSDATDPVAAAEGYLAGTGMSVTGPSSPATPGQPTFEVLSNADGLAVVEWSAIEGSVTRSGTIHLRANPVDQAGGTAGATWSVVASTAEGIALADVAYDGEQLAFTVTKTSPVAGPLAVGVWSDGEQVAVDGDAVEAAAGSAGGSAGDSVGAGVGTDDGAAGAGAGLDGDSLDAAAGTEQATAAAGASAGEPPSPPSLQTVDIPDDAGSSVPLTAVVDEASTAVIRVQQLVDDRPVAVTEMAVALPGADAGAGAGVAGPGAGNPGVDAGAGAEAGAEGDTGLVPTTAGPAEALEGAGEAVDGVEDVVRGDDTPPSSGDGDDTPPSLPTTLPSVPTTLPAPPSGGRMP